MNKKVFIFILLPLLIIISGCGLEIPVTDLYNEDIYMSDVPKAIKDDSIILDYPLPESNVSSPLKITGQARGNWFFEASFPVILTNWDGLIIAEGIAQAKGDWMTEDFVAFEAELVFESDTTVSNRGSLILQKDNPSGLPEFDDALEITVFFE